MMRVPRAMLRSIDNGRLSSQRSSLRPRFVQLFLAISLVASVATLPQPGSIAQEATPSSLSESAAISPAEAASTWLREQQDQSGGFIGLSGEPDPGTTTDAVMALYAAQRSDPAATASLDAALAYLEQEENGATYARTGPGQAAKLALAAVIGGRDPRHFAGLDLVAAMTAPLATPVPAAIAGIYGDDLYDHALVLIALTAIGEAIPDAALESLRAAQGEDGGWAFDGSTTPGAADSNTTALVIQALVAAGHGDDPMVDRGLPFLLTLLAPDGGFAYGPADPLVADANSTALVLQALIAAGEDPTLPEWGNASLALARFQTPSGGLRYMTADEEPNLLATVQAIPAMEGLPLPIARACAKDDSGEDCISLEPAA